MNRFEILLGKKCAISPDLDRVSDTLFRAPFNGSTLCDHCIHGNLAWSLFPCRTCGTFDNDGNFMSPRKFDNFVRRE
jgi:hypothetical protein